jgi:hypothetical protein
MRHADAIRARLAPLLPVDYEWQFGAWQDTSGAKTKRFAVVKPAGGGLASIVREPQFVVSLIGRDGGDRERVAEHADTCVQALQHAGRDAGGIVLFASEPRFIPTADNRPVFDIAIAALSH